METLTIQLPNALVEKIKARGISPQQLSPMISLFLVAYFQEIDKAKEEIWPDAAEFATRLIAENPELFAKLAKL
jgi:hypothetical protein